MTNFQKEAYSDVVKTRRLDRIQKSKKNIVPKAFLPSDISKQSSGLGGNFGTFGLNGQTGHKYFSGGFINLLQFRNSPGGYPTGR